MSNAITSSGITTKTQAELLAELTASFKSIYGNDINLDSDSPDGQLMNIFIQATVDTLELVTDVYNSMSPDTAVGVTLDQRVALNGIVRQGGTYTVTPVTLVASQACTLYGLDQSVEDVYTISDNSGNNWLLTTTETITVAGTYIYNFRAENPGQVSTVINTITTPVTIVLGIDTINNPSTYTVLGMDEETDSALRLRRLKSVSLVSTGFQASLLAALRNISGVTDAYVYENNTDYVDSNGIPPHSIWVITAGSGSAADIADAIYSKRNAGCGMYGGNVHQVTQSDGTLFSVYWDDVTVEPVWVKFAVTSIDGITAPDIASIRTDLVTNYVPGVYGDVNTSTLSTEVQSIDPNTLVTNGGFCSTSATGSFTSLLYPSDKNHQFIMSEANIIITPMILKSVTGNLTVSAGVVYSTITKARGTTEQLTGLGGYGTLTYTMSSNPSGGSVVAATGVYTAGGSVGTDVVLVTDSLGNTATITVTVI